MNNAVDSGGLPETALPGPASRGPASRGAASRGAASRGADGLRPAPARRGRGRAVLAFLRESRLSILSLLAFLLAWEAVCRLGIIGPYQLVPPSRVAKVLVLKMVQVNPDGARLWAHALASLGLALLGFAAAAVVGVPLGLVMGWWPRINMIARPVFDMIRPVPPIAWIPLAILWLGIGVEAKAFIIFLASFVPCVINSFTGIRLANPVLARVARIHGAGNFAVFWRIGVPSAVPMIFTGLRLSLNAAWTTLVAAELLAASRGLGFLIQMGRRLARPDIVIVGMLSIGFLGALLALGLTLVERRLSASRRLL